MFARTGYAQARVDEIAAEANVAKATVYNHFGAKQTLFRQAVQELSDTALAANLAAVELLANPDDDVSELLRKAGFQLATCYVSEESQALRRLIYAEATQFPDLLDIVEAVSSRVTRALADRLARLALSGTLRITDPDIAAAQFAALLTGPAETLSRLGTRPVTEPALKATTDAAVTTFLAAFGG